MYWVNGKNERVIDVSDRGLQYGDGLFETIKIEAGKPLFLAKHLHRLKKGCERLLIPPPATELLTQEATTISASQLKGVLKIIVTRGSGGRGYRPPNAVSPTRILSIHDLPSMSDNLNTTGIAIRLCQHRLSCNPALAGIKHLNKLEQILARAEWHDDDAFQEGIMLDPHNHVIDGTMSNLFQVKDRCLFTAPVDQCGVAGITRRIVLILSEQMQMPCREHYFTFDQLAQADEIFMTNALWGIRPVKQLGNKLIKLGPITQQLQAAYQRLVSQNNQ